MTALAAKTEIISEEDDEALPEPNEDGSTTVKLAVPKVRKEGTLEAITLTRPNGKQLRKLDDVKGEMAKTLSFISELSGLPVPVVEALDGYDVVRLGKVVDRYLGKSPRTGRKS